MEKKLNFDFKVLLEILPWISLVCKKKKNPLLRIPSIEFGPTWNIFLPIFLTHVFIPIQVNKYVK